MVNNPNGPHLGAGPSPLDAVRAALAEVYQPEAIEIWLHAPHPMLNGERAIDVIERGGGQRVMQIIAQLADGVFV